MTLVNPSLALNSASAGFTLVELVISIAIAGIVISGVVVTSAQLAARTADPMLASQRIHIAQSYLEEITSQEFEFVGASCLSNPGSRQLYTQVCQYDNLTNSPVEDQFGNVPNGLENYKVSVDVPSNGGGSNKLGPSGAKLLATQVMLVTVTVASPDGAQTKLSQYVVDNGP